MLRVPSSTVSSRLRILALVPHFHRAAIARFILADANAFRVVAVSAERRRAARADPFVAALMTLLLLLETFLQRLDELVPAAQRLDLRLFLLGQRALAHAPQPFLRNAREHRFEGLFGALEVRGEGTIEAIKMPLVLHQAGARQEVEIFRARIRKLRLKRFEQRQELGDRYRHAAFAQFEEETESHDGRDSGGDRSAILNKRHLTCRFAP